MNVSEFIFQFLKAKGVDTAFVITGGQAMHLDDALCRTPEIKPIFVHHEQVASMSADAYSRISGKLGVALVTAGPGAINITNGLVGGYIDSAPMMIISGQTNYRYVKYMAETQIRQIGVQGIDIRPFVEHATKFFVTVDDPCKIAYYMEKAYYMAFSGRPGPVWIDVPIDIQSMTVPERLLSHFTPESDGVLFEQRRRYCKQILDEIQAAKRPLIVAGQGVRLSGMQSTFLSIVEKLSVPVVTSRLGIDLIDSSHMLYVGRIGNNGERSANMAVQSADLIVALGSRLATSAVGHNSADFGRNAKIIMVDIDQKELDKPGVIIDVKINDDLKKLLPCLLEELNGKTIKPNTEWIAKCRRRKEQYPVVLPEYQNETPLNSYYFTKKLSDLCSEDMTVLLDTGSCFHVVSQAWEIKQGQKFLTTGGLSSMGYWAACIGALAANDYKNTVAITGDGSLQMNIQEFATLRHLNKPIKLFIFNNSGYLLIKNTQRGSMNNRLFGVSAETGLYFPDSVKVAEAYGIKAVRIESLDDMEDKIKEVLAYDGPVVCDVITAEWQPIVPRVASVKNPDGTMSSKKFEDMFPFLTAEELEEAMSFE